MATDLHSGIAHHRAGRLQEAAGCYRRVLAGDPEQVDALHLLGLILHQTGAHGDGVTLIRRALAHRPGEAVIHANLADALFAAGDRAGAETAVRAALSLDPTLIEARNLLGALLLERGEPTEAEVHLREVLRLAPGHGHARSNLALLLARTGNSEASLETYRSAAEAAPDSPTVLADYGQALIRAGRLDEALATFATAVALDPQSADAYEGLGRIFHQRGQDDAALALYQRALRLRPDRVGIHTVVGQLLHGIGRSDLAEEAYRHALTLAPTDHRLHRLLGALCHERGELETSLQHHRQAVELAPDAADPLTGLAGILMDLDRHAEARPLIDRALELPGDRALALATQARWHHERGELSQCALSARAALTLQPYLVPALHCLASVDRTGLSPVEIDAITTLSADPAASDQTRCITAFDLAAIKDGRGDLAGAARVLRQANALQAGIRLRSGEGYDRRRHRGRVEALMRGVTTELVSSAGSHGDPTEVPVFIVGLPRSGTTLVEQILSSLPQVVGAGELTVVGRAWAQATGSTAEEDGDPGLAFHADRLKSAAASVLAGLRQRGGDAERIIDKMPDNALHVGFIAAMFPRARILVCRRDLRDTALSCHSTHFRQIRWTNDPLDLGWRFADHQRLMAHWNAILPGRLITVDYELLVADLAGTARRMLASLGLPWDPRCLEFHRNGRTVRTASLAQVRQPIHARSVGRWQAYANHLPELFAALPASVSEGPGG